MSDFIIQEDGKLYFTKPHSDIKAVFIETEVSPNLGDNEESEFPNGKSEVFVMIDGATLKVATYMDESNHLDYAKDFVQKEKYIESGT